MKATLKNRQIIAENTLLATFATETTATFKAGQFVLIALINPPYQDEKGSERYFSIVNSPNNKKEISITTRLRDSAFKKSLSEIPYGTQIEIKMIGGVFTLPDDSGRPVVFITGGIGITPFMSMLRLANENNFPHKISLLYFNRTKESTAYLEELELLEKENPNFNLILIMTEDNNWQGEKNLVSADLIKKYFSDYPNNVYMVAGPPKMVQDVTTVLTDMGIVSENIITENFAGY